MAFFIQAKAQEPAWKLLQETEGVKVYYAALACGSEQFLALKLENTNIVSVAVHLMLEVSEGEHHMHYPMLMAHLEAGKAEVMDCQNLGMKGEFIPFHVGQIADINLQITGLTVQK